MARSQPLSSTATADIDEMAAEYNKTMNMQMQWGDPFEYHPQVKRSTLPEIPIFMTT
jgi:hypothetical protein